MNSVIITGTQVAYYNICHRKLWLFSKNITMEHNSELIEIGDTIHQNYSSKSKKEILLDGIKIDLIETKKGIIHEIKKSKALDIAHIWQIKYYLYYFKKLDIILEGVIDYPLLRRKELVSLTEEDCKQIEDILNNIQIIIKSDSIPPINNKSYCKNCSYYDFCYI